MQSIRQDVQGSWAQAAFRTLPKLGASLASSLEVIIWMVRQRTVPFALVHTVRCVYSLLLHSLGHQSGVADKALQGEMAKKGKDAAGAAPVTGEVSLDGMCGGGPRRGACRGFWVEAPPAQPLWPRDSHRIGLLPHKRYTGKPYQRSKRARRWWPAHTCA